MKTEKFDIEKAKAGAKVVTRDDRPVRIVCYDGNDKEQPICAFVADELDIATWCVNGSFYTDLKSDYDLFLVSEEEEPTEFEKELRCAIFGYQQQVERGEITSYSQDDDFIKEKTQKLLELARKEISKDNVIVTLSEWETLAEKFKDLPKWKKFDFGDDFDKHFVVIPATKWDVVLYNSDDKEFIPIDDLEKLPKEQDNE